MTDQTFATSSTAAVPRGIVGKDRIAPATQVIASPAAEPDGVEIELNESPFVELVVTHPPEPPAPPLEYGEVAEEDWIYWFEEV